MGCLKSKPIGPAPDHIEGDKRKAEGSEGSGSKRSVLQGLKDSIQQSPSSDIWNKCVDVVTADIASIDSVYDGVRDGQVLGYGITGAVRLVTHKVTGAQYAVKYLSLNQIESAQGLMQLREEIAVLMQLDHPNIVKLESVYESEDEIYLVQELCEGGDLFDRLDAQPEEHYSEAQCAKLVSQMLSAVRYIHSKGIIHRDLKLENFLFDRTGPDGELKMIDFGLSKHFKCGERHHEPVGTRYTVAPEVLKRTYDEKVDVWAIGVITFLLLSGDAPFGGCGGDSECMEHIRINILNAKYSFEPVEYWSHVSDVAKNFISHILVADPNLRPTAEQCQAHPWMREWDNREDIKALSVNVKNALRKFGGLSDIRKLLCEVIGFTLLPDQIVELRKEFEKLDVEHSGEISLANLKKVLMANVGSKSFGDMFTEDEVEEIFNSMRLHKTDTTIHWHHFIAAGLSECAVDERNHKLAFEKLDHDKKGYITFDDIVELTGPESMIRRIPSLKAQWGDSIILCKSGSKIGYEDFVKIMESLPEDEKSAEEKDGDAEMCEFSYSPKRGSCVWLR